MKNDSITKINWVLIDKNKIISKFKKINLYIIF